MSTKVEQNNSNVIKARNEETGDRTLNSLSVRTYLDKTVMPLLLKGLTDLSKEK